MVRNLPIFVAGVALPVLLCILGAGGNVTAVALLLMVLCWWSLWDDVGFALGGLLFWGVTILGANSSVEPDQVDNILPGLAVVFGWLPYMIFLGPLFLFFKSMRRVRELTKPMSLQEIESVAAPSQRSNAES